MTSKPGEPILITKAGRTVSKSRNLRGVMNYARKSYVREWRASMTDDYGARIWVTFEDGAESRFEFASWDVAQRWIRARRSWGLQAIATWPTHETFGLLCGDARY